MKGQPILSTACRWWSKTLFKRENLPRFVLMVNVVNRNNKFLSVQEIAAENCLSLSTRTILDTCSDVVVVKEELQTISAFEKWRSSRRNFICLASTFCNFNLDPGVNLGSYMGLGVRS